MTAHLTKQQVPAAVARARRDRRRLARHAITTPRERDGGRAGASSIDETYTHRKSERSSFSWGAIRKAHHPAGEVKPGNTARNDALNTPKEETSNGEDPHDEH